MLKLYTIKASLILACTTVPPPPFTLFGPSSRCLLSVTFLLSSQECGETVTDLFTVLLFLHGEGILTSDGFNNTILPSSFLF